MVQLGRDHNKCVFQSNQRMFLLDKTISRIDRFVIFDNSISIAITWCFLSPF